LCIPGKMQGLKPDVLCKHIGHSQIKQNPRFTPTNKQQQTTNQQESESKYEKWR